MELHKRRAGLLAGALILVVGLLFLLCTLTGGISSMVLGLIVAIATITAGVGVMATSLTPWRCRIGPEGMTLRLGGIDRVVHWEEVEALVLDRLTPTDRRHGNAGPRLLLVPADGIELRARRTEPSPVDGRTCLVLFELAELKESPQQVAEAIERFAGGRFVDTHEPGQDAYGVPEFSVVLRGYEPWAVDKLIQEGKDALVSGRTPERMAVKAKIDEASLPVAMRGFDRYQVDSFLRALSAELVARSADDDADETGETAQARIGEPAGNGDPAGDSDPAGNGAPVGSAG